MLGILRFAIVSAAIGFTAFLSACASDGPVAGDNAAFLSAPQSQTGIVPAPPPPESYRIGPLDKLNINVYQVKDLTINDLQVDSGGRIVLPLIGSVVAAGKTAPELSNEIADKLRGTYLQAPQVTVWVSDAISQKVTVDGSVVQPGVYALSGPTTLIQAIAMAKGPDHRYADLKRVAVFRTINGQRQVAVFNLKDIRQGRAPDPEIRGNDVIVVDGSEVKGAWREVIGALPALGIFRIF